MNVPFINSLIIYVIILKRFKKIAILFIIVQKMYNMEAMAIMEIY